MTKTLQQMTNVPNGTATNRTVVDLGAATYSVGDDPNVQYPWFISDTQSYIDVVGEGATVVVKPSALRVRPGLLVRGANIRLRGDVTIIGPRPDGWGTDLTREGQSGIELQGAINFDSCWNVRNMFGPNFNLFKRFPANRWSKGVTLHDFESHQAGTQHVALQAADDVHIFNYLMRDCNFSVIDCEPPGSDSGTHRFVWGPGDIRGHFAEVFANKGAGNSTSCQDITLDGIRAHGRAFGVRVVPPDGVRRQRYTIQNCTSDTTLNLSPLTFWHIDGVTVHNITQPLTKGTALARFNDCSGIVTDPGVPIVQG